MTTKDAAFTEHAMTKGSGADVPMSGNRYTLPDDDGNPVVWNGATTLAAELDNPYALQQWQMRQVAWGIGLRPDLMALAGSVTDPKSADDKATLRKVVADALAAASTEQGANHGTALHNIYYKIDTGTPMSEVPSYFHADIVARQQELALHGIIILPEYRERVIRCAIYGCAGRLDGIGKLADGSLVLIDDKSEEDPERYSHAKTVQMGIYANAGKLMNYDTNRLESMPDVRKDLGLVIHTRPGSGKCTVYRVDIARGWAAARIAVELREWRKAKGLVAPYISEGSWAPSSPIQDNNSAPEMSGFTQPMAQAVAKAVSNGTPDPVRVEEIKNAVLDEVRGRLPEVQANPIPTNPQSAPAAPPVVDPATRIIEIMEVRKNDKSRLQRWASDLGCVDLTHHRKWLATWIVNATPESGAIEPSTPALSGPKSMAEAGFTGPAPAQPPGQPVITAPALDLTPDGVASMLDGARALGDIGAVWKAYTDTYGPDSWEGWVKERADNRAAELSAQPATVTNPYMANPLA